jgi:hypothetical protein
MAVAHFAGSSKFWFVILGLAPQAYADARYRGLLQMLIKPGQHAALYV